MKLVLDAAPNIGKNYGIIINKVSEGVLNLLENHSNKEEFIDSIFHKFPKKQRCVDRNIIFFEEVDELEDEDDVLVSPELFKDQHKVIITP